MMETGVGSGDIVLLYCHLTNEVHPDLVYDWNCNGTVELNPDTSQVVNIGSPISDEGYRC